MRVTIAPARTIEAVGVRGDTARLEGTTLVVGTVARTRGDTLWVALTTQRDVRGETRHWGRRRAARVAIVPGPEVRVARIAGNARAGETLVVGSLLTAAALFVALIATWDPGT